MLLLRVRDGTIACRHISAGESFSDGEGKKGGPLTDVSELRRLNLLAGNIRPARTLENCEFTGKRVVGTVPKRTRPII
jgi:hypothetical protein